MVQSVKNMLSERGSSTAIEKGLPDEKISIIKLQRYDERTDYSRWRMRNERGRQTWHYLQDDKMAADWPQSIADKYFLGLPLDLPILTPTKTALGAVNNGLEFFKELQLPSGNWGGDDSGPMFLIPAMVTAWAVTETPIPEAYRTEIKNYLFARQNPEDGGWGLHVEADSSVFGTAMNYTVLRLLGASAEDDRMAKARNTLHKMGGALNGPHWAKFMLAVLNIVDWDAVNPVPPDLWLLPDWAPIAPSRWWVHIRQVFLPMSYIWSRRWSAPITPLTVQLRRELLTEPYKTINFSAYRNTISPQDNYHPKSWLLNTANWLLVNIYDPFLRLQRLAMESEARAYRLIQHENENTDYICLGPINISFNLIACYIAEGADSYSVKRLRERTEDYLWVKDDGMLVNGTNGTQVWDTAFLIQAAVKAGCAEDEKWRPMLTKALEFLEDQQIRENIPDQERCYRHQRKGGWPFSTKAQGYPVSDCISEAIKAVILLQRTPGYPILLDDQRIYDTIDTLLTYQNTSGGCASYEPTRGGEYMEMLNAAEVFGRIMIEYDYTECTNAVVTALTLFSEQYPDYRADEIKAFNTKALDYIRCQQNSDGSWYGSWGICYTYATMFALESLASVGEIYTTSERAKKGCDFLLSKQREDGGWSECYKSCENNVYTEHPAGSQIVMTSWACIGLIHAKYPDKTPIQKGLRLIMSRQQSNGEWLQEAVEGIFNKSCMISYPNYKFTFTIMALGMYAMHYGNGILM
ncbi:oxidosqualene:lanosterol cyclase-like protein [Xylogone sp. PMI_703]|nr:oxidosqualene:lanosterol cyclase-like protein [Xylogone sp. PMI_703]